MLPWSPHPKQNFDRFSRLCAARDRESLYFTMSRPSPQNCFFSWGIWTPIWYMAPLAHQSPLLKRHLDHFIGFAGLTIVTDRQRDRPRYSVCNNRPHLYVGTPCLKNIPPITLTHVHGFWHSLAEMLPIKWAIKRHFTTSNNLCFCTTWQNGKHENCIFFT